MIELQIQIVSCTPFPSNQSKGRSLYQVSNGTAEGTGTDAERRASQAWCGRMGGAACSGSLRTFQDVTSCMPQDAGRHKAGVQFWGDVYAYDHADYKCEIYIHLVH